MKEKSLAITIQNEHSRGEKIIIREIFEIRLKVVYSALDEKIRKREEKTQESQKHKLRNTPE